MLFAAKLFAAPLLIWILTLIGRRFGPSVSGLLMGIPLITGPVLFFLAAENGGEFEAKALTANLMGQVSTCLFCFAFARTALNRSAGLSALTGVAAFLTATAIWHQFEWTLVPALSLLLLTITALPLLMPVHPLVRMPNVVPRWDLPLRMALSAAFVVAMTQIAKLIGPQMSGLIAPFPTFVLILAVFTHREAGGKAAANLARGVVRGSFSFAAFFVCVHLASPMLGLGSYLLAAFASVGVSAAVYALRKADGPTRDA